MKIPGFICPDEAKAVQRDAAPPSAVHFPSTYAFNGGSWHFFTALSAYDFGVVPGDGSFGPNTRFSPRDFLDGMSNTLCYSEVKAYTPNGGGIDPPDDTPPTSLDLTSFITGTVSQTGHTEWVDGKIHEVGFTTTFTPNSDTIIVAAVGSTPAVIGDVITHKERNAAGLGKPTYAAVTARSYHNGMVQSLLMDGSVRVVSDEINLSIWQALGTRNGEEAIASEF